MSIAHAVLCLGLVITLAGCESGHKPEMGHGNPPSASYDGHYEGTVQVTGVMSGGDLRLCETDPRLSLQVSNNTFSYTQAHANVPAAMVDRATVVYTASIAPNGAIAGTSNAYGKIEGRVSASHMSGTMKGAACFYTFAADRS